MEVTKLVNLNYVIPSACSLSASSSQLSTGGLLGLASEVDKGASVVGLDSVKSYSVGYVKLFT